MVPGTTVLARATNMIVIEQLREIRIIRPIVRILHLEKAGRSFDLG